MIGKVVWVGQGCVIIKDLRLGVNVRDVVGLLKDMDECGVNISIWDLKGWRQREGIILEDVES